MPLFQKQVFALNSFYEQISSTLPNVGQILVSESCLNDQALQVHHVEMAVNCILSCTACEASSGSKSSRRFSHLVWFKVYTLYM